ncbi:peptidylprolyl isomerase [bacterium]|nr:peptidylprolyl isomerase [bacterium]
MKGTKLLATIMVASMLFTGCSLKDNNAIIKINDGKITQKEFDTLLDKQIAQSPMAQMGDIKSNKNGMLYLMMAQRVLNQLIIEELLDQEAKERGIKVSSKEVSEGVAKIIDKVGGKDKLTEILKQNGLSPSQFREDVRKQVRMQKLAKTAGKINITEEDCKKFYNENSDKFKHDNQVRASHILLMANPYQIQQELTANAKQTLTEDALKSKVEAKMKEKKELADKLAKELKADNSKFAAYAKKYSEDENSAKQGGDLGFFDKKTMVPEFAKAAFEAKPNTVTDVVQTQYGYHIIMVTDRKEAGIVPYEKTKSDIKEFLESSKEIEALDTLTQAAKKKAKIEYVNEDYNPDVVEKKLSEQMGALKQGLGAPAPAQPEKK